MDLADELLRLRDRLAATPSPIQRMKLLARAWRTLRRLSPEDRKRLAAEVGTEGAQEVLEGLASRSGRVTPAVLLTALEKLRGSDPQELSGILRDLKDPQRRIDGLRRGVDKLGSVIAEPKPPTAEPPEQAEQMMPAEPPPARGDVAPQAGTERVAVEQPPEPPPPPPLPAEDRVLAPEPEPAAPPSPPPRVEQPVPPEPPPPDGSELLARVERAPTLMRRLGEARSLLDRAGELSVDQLRALLDLFPRDWAKRRVLTGLLKRGVPRDLHQAIYLIEALESKTSRRWCVSVLLHEWELSEAERRALIERAGLAVVGRRRFAVRGASDRPRA